MPSSFSFLLNSPSNSSNSSSENVSKGDQSDDDDDGDINVKYYKKRTIQTDNDMLECPSDHDDSCSQSDVTDNDEHDEKKQDHFTSSNNPRSIYIARQATLYDDEWPRRSSIDENKIKKSTHNDVETFAEIEPNDTFFLNSNQHRVFSPERSKSGSIVDKKYQSRNIHTPLPSDFITTTQDFQSFPEPVDMKTTLSLSQNKTNTITSPMNKDTRPPLSKIPIRANSSSQSRSSSPAKNRHVSSPKTSSKIPVPVSTTSKGAFHFFNADDRSSLPQQQHPTKDSGRVKNPITNKQASPFTPITHRKTFPSSAKTISSAGNTPTAKYARKTLVISDDDEDSETNNLKEDDLKLKLKEQKRYGKKTEEILDQLHENYEELLEKYAQAENTIDQLRFQPKIYSDYTPSSNASEGTVHFIHQPKVNLATLRANGIYHSTSATPLSSIMRATSATISTTANTPAAKSTSPANSVTIESVFFDESAPQKIIVEELTTPETLKLDLLIQTKTLGGKMKSFITLMDANQLSLAEQKQVYETIKDDYEKLLKVFDRTKRGSDFSDIDFDADLNTELEMMKQLLKEIVTRITDNLLGKSSNGLDIDGQSRRTHSDTHSSQVSARSSICNHTDLMDQYHKLLNAVNAGIVEKKKEIKPLHTGFETGSEQVKKTPSHISSQSDIPVHLPQTTKNEKQYIYRSGNSDDEQQPQQRSHDTTPVQLIKDVESTQFELDYIPSTSNKHHQQINDEQPHLLDTITATKRIKPPSKREIQQYDNLENITKSTRKIKIEQQKIINHSQPDHELSPPSLSFATGGAHYSTRSMRTRTSDYDSGIGTNNTTKLSRDSKLNTTMMDETHYQSLDEDRRRYTDEEQESMSSVSTSCSSGSGVQSPGISYDKYTKRFDTFSSSRTLNENSRRKPNGHSDVYPSDHETHITGSFDTLPQPSANKRKPRHSHPNLQTQQTVPHRSRSTPFHRRISIENIDIDNSKNNSQETAPHQHKMGRKYQTGFIHRQPASSTHPQTTYRSACYIDQPHTHRRSQEKVEQNQRQSYKQVQPPVRKPADNLYLDPQTGIVYQYVSNKSQPSTMTHYQPNSQAKPSNGLYQCPECGCMTPYHHRHHTHSTMKRVTKDIDDPGYESGNRKNNRRRQYIDHLISSDSDCDDHSTHLDLSVLNEAYERARKVQHRSQTLSRHISRQLKLVLATI